MAPDLNFLNAGVQCKKHYSYPTHCLLKWLHGPSENDTQSNENNTQLSDRVHFKRHNLFENTIKNLLYPFVLWEYRTANVHSSVNHTFSEVYLETP